MKRGEGPGEAAGWRKYVAISRKGGRAGGGINELGVSAAAYFRNRSFQNISGKLSPATEYQCNQTKSDSWFLNMMKSIN